MGTGLLRMIHSRVSWICFPVERSMTVSAPQRMPHTIFSTPSAMPEDTAELPMFALIFTRKLRPMIIGSVSGWLMLFGTIARPRATSARTNSGVMNVGAAARVVHLRAGAPGFRPPRLSVQIETQPGELGIGEPRAAVRGGKAVERN